jgi:hypothetical protein
MLLFLNGVNAKRGRTFCRNRFLGRWLSAVCDIAARGTRFVCEVAVARIKTAVLYIKALVLIE